MSELGRTLRWSDLRAFIAHLPATSHFRRLEDPERARRAELMEIPNQLLMKVYDAAWAAAYAQSGIEFEPPSLRSTLMGDLKAGRNTDGDTPPKRRQKTATEIRAEVATRIRT